MAGGPRFTIVVADGRLVLSGELDLSSAGELIAAAVAVAPAGSPFLVDLTAVSFVDSVGLRTLLMLRRDHPAVCFEGAAHQLRRLAETAGVAEHLFGG
jgi:anti-anti-sigma factor